MQDQKMQITEKGEIDIPKTVLAQNYAHLGGVAVGGTFNNNPRLHGGCGRMMLPPPNSPASQRTHCAMRIAPTLSVEHVGPLKEKRRVDGTEFLHWRVTAMRNSAEPAQCAPGSQGPPAYCEQLDSASSSRTLQLTLGQTVNFLFRHFKHVDSLSCSSHCMGIA